MIFQIFILWCSLKFFLKVKDRYRSVSPEEQSMREALKHSSNMMNEEQSMHKLDSNLIKQGSISLDDQVGLAGMMMGIGKIF